MESSTESSMRGTDPGESRGQEEGETYYEKGVGGERSEVWVWPSDHGESEMPVCKALCCSLGEGQLWELNKIK